MIKKVFLTLTLVAAFTVADIVATSGGLTGNTCISASIIRGSAFREKADSVIVATGM